MTQGQPLSRPTKSKCPMITVTLWTFFQTTLQTYQIYIVASFMQTKTITQSAQRGYDYWLVWAGGFLLLNLLIVLFTFLYTRSSKPCWFQTALIMRILIDLAFLFSYGDQLLRELEIIESEQGLTNISNQMKFAICFNLLCCVMIFLCFYFMVWTCKQQKKKVQFENAQKDPVNEPLNHS